MMAGCPSWQAAGQGSELFDDFRLTGSLRQLEVAPKPNIFRDPGEEILDVLVAENPEHFLSILVCMGKVNHALVRIQ